MSQKVIIFSAPSGAGKTTVVSHLMKRNNYFGFSISACTREPRENEVNGKDYHFLSLEDFKQKIEENAFIEWEEVYPNKFYGTLKSEIERLWQEGKIVVFDVDVKGGINLKEYFGEKALSVFVKAPSLDIIKKRLFARQTESAETLETRLQKAEYEMTFASQFDKILINDNLEETLKEVDQIASQLIEE